MNEDLRFSAALIRKKYLGGKPVGKSNVAVAEIHLAQNISFCAGATSRGGRQSPIQIPIPKSQGGQFEPSLDSYSGRLMDTDAEYKVVSEIANILDRDYNVLVKGNLYLYTELQPCESCKGILQQFQEKFIHVVITVFWDYPYPPDR